MPQKNIPAPCEHITRIGGENDGGKMFCSDGFPQDCVVYSLGSRLDFTFEIDVVKRLKCVVYTFDCTVGEPEAEKIPAGIRSFPLCIGEKDEVKSFTSDLLEQGQPHNGHYHTLDTILTKLGHARVGYAENGHRTARTGCYRVFITKASARTTSI